MSDQYCRPAFRATTGFDSRIGLAPSRLLDLSFNGALLESHECFNLGHKCTLRIGEPSILLPAFVVRCRLVRVDSANGRPVYEAGLSFDASPALRQQLAGTVATLARDRVEAPRAAFG